MRGFQARFKKPRLEPDLSVPLLYANFPLTKVTSRSSSRFPNIFPFFARALRSPPRGRPLGKGPRIPNLT